jgi:asparagine synthase (glutamine-hydrolysing)
MPGIAGFVAESHMPINIRDQMIDQMVGALRYDDRYRHGTYSNAEMNICIGWTCHEGSFSDCMPIFNESRDIVLFMAGEIFPDSSEIRKLRGKGHAFSDGDASYVVHLYEETGDEFFGGLNGWYSGLLMDMREHRAFLFNDRFGMHRLFIREGKDGFFFASEAKALLAVLPETREYDIQGLCEMLCCDCTLGNRSLFKGIDVLPGATVVEFKAGRRQKHQFFDRKTWEEQAGLPEEKFISSFAELFPDIARKYLTSKTAAAMSLTGGLDSRMVLGCLNLEPGKLPCYTFGSPYRETFDVIESRKIAKACGQRYEVLTLGGEFLDALPTYLEKAVYISDGYIGLSGAAELYANAMARSIAPVRLTGNWGSELLRGARAFKFVAPGDGLINPDLLREMDAIRLGFVESNQMNGTSFAAFQQAPYQGYGRLAVERSQVDLRSPFLDNHLVELLYQAPEMHDGLTLASTVIARCMPDLLTIPTDRGRLGSGTIPERAILRAYREFLFKAEYATGNGAPDWCLKLMTFFPFSFMEDAMRGRHKFSHFRKWIRDHMAEYIRDSLRSARNSSLQMVFNCERIECLVNDHLDGTRNYTAEIDKILTLLVTHALLFQPSNSR